MAPIPFYHIACEELQQADGLKMCCHLENCTVITYQTYCLLISFAIYYKAQDTKFKSKIFLWVQLTYIFKLQIHSNG